MTIRACAGTGTEASDGMRIDWDAPIELTGCGPFLHDDPTDRPADPFAGTTTIHTGGERASYLLLPVVPPA